MGLSQMGMASGTIAWSSSTSGSRKNSSSYSFMYYIMDDLNYYEHQSTQYFHQLEEKMRGLPIALKNEMKEKMQSITSKGTADNPSFEQLKLYACIRLQIQFLEVEGTEIYRLISEVWHSYHRGDEVVSMEVFLMRITHSLLDMRVSLWYQSDRLVTCGQIGLQIEEHNLWSSILESNQQIIAAFFIGIIIEELENGEIENVFEVMKSLCRYLMKRIKGQNSKLLKLLHVNLSCRLLRSVYQGSVDMELERMIHAAIYEIDYQTLESLSAQYKKMKGSTSQEIVAFIIRNLREFILNYDIRKVMQFSFIKLKQQENLSSKNIFRIHRSLEAKKERNVYVDRPLIKQISGNVFISVLKNKSLHPLRKKEPLRLLNYQESKKHIINKKFERDMLLCKPPREKLTLKNVSKRKSILEVNSTRKSLVLAEGTKKKRFSTRRLSESNMSGKEPSVLQPIPIKLLKYPVNILIIIEKYTHCFLELKLHYQTLKHSIPFFRLFKLIEPHVQYWIFGRVICFIRIEEDNCQFKFTIKENQTYQIISLNSFSCSLLQLFQRKTPRKTLLMCANLGGNLDIYQLKLEGKQPLIHEKRANERIGFRYEVQDLTVTGNYFIFNRHLAKITLIDAQRYYFGVFNSSNEESREKLVLIQKKIRETNPVRSLNLIYQYLSEAHTDQRDILLKIRNRYYFMSIKVLELGSKCYLLLRTKKFLRIKKFFAMISMKRGKQIDKMVISRPTFYGLAERLVEDDNIKQETWEDIFTNRPIFESISSKIVIKKERKGFYLATIKPLQLFSCKFTDKHDRNWLICLVSDSTKSWFSLLKMSNILQQSNRLFQLQTRHLLKLKRGTPAENQQKTQRQSIHDKMEKLCNKLKFMQMEMCQEESILKMGLTQFKLTQYDQTWTMILDQCIVYCFRIGMVVLTLKINKFNDLRIQSYWLSAASIPQQISFNFKIAGSSKIFSEKRVFYHRFLEKYQEGKNIYVLAGHFPCIYRVSLKEGCIHAQPSNPACPRLEVSERDLTFFNHESKALHKGIMYHPKFRQRIVCILQAKLIEMEQASPFDNQFTLF